MKTQPWRSLLGIALRTRVRLGSKQLLALTGFTCWLQCIAGSAQTGLSLHDAIERAQYSPVARIAQAQIDVAQGQTRQAGLRPNPRLYLQSEDLRPWASDFDFPSATEDYAYIGQTFEMAGKRSKRLQLANANLHRAEAQRTLGLQQLAGRIAASYWTVVATERIRVLLEGDLVAVDDMVRYHKKRVDAGAMRGVDLLRMQIERDRIYIALQAARRSASLARIDFAREIGQPIGDDVQLTDPIDALDPVLPQTLAAVLAQRADVRVAQESVAAAEADLKLQRALSVPDVDLFGGYKRNTGANTLYGGLQIPIPLRNRNQGEIQRAQASLRIAQAQMEQTKMLVQADMDAATEAYSRELDIAQKTLPEMREHAKKNLDILSDAYKTGGTDLLRYIDAERTEIDVEVNALKALAEFHQSALRLQLAYGVQP